MKIFTRKDILQKKKVIQKVILILVFLILFNFMSPTIVKAVDADEVGGVLFSPIQFLVLGIGDTLMWLANSCAYGEEVDPILTLSESWSAFSITNIALAIITRTYRISNYINIYYSRAIRI